jgi:hypothetical protein
MSVSVRTVRLTCSAFYVDARLTEVKGRWLASADTPDGPSMGTGDSPPTPSWRHFSPSRADDELMACATLRMDVAVLKPLAFAILSTFTGS